MQCRRERKLFICCYQFSVFLVHSWNAPIGAWQLVKRMQFFSTTIRSRKTNGQGIFKSAKSRKPPCQLTLFLFHANSLCLRPSPPETITGGWLRKDQGKSLLPAQSTNIFSFCCWARAASPLSTLPCKMLGVQFFLAWMFKFSRLSISKKTFSFEFIHVQVLSLRMIVV